MPFDRLRRHWAHRFSSERSRAPSSPPLARRCIRFWPSFTTTDLRLWSSHVQSIIPLGNGPLLALVFHDVRPKAGEAEIFCEEIRHPIPLVMLSPRYGIACAKAGSA